MKKLKKKLNSNRGITLIALVISIIVMLILAGVSINAVVGDNGIITKAQNSNYVMSKAVLEEWIQQIYVGNYDEFSEFDTKIEALTTSNKYKQYFYNPSTDSGIGAVNYVVDNDGHALYLIKKSALPDDIKNQITGGDAGEGTYRDYLSLNDVYGVTSDLRVYYCSNGADSIYGLTKDELDNDNPARLVTLSSSLANAIGTDTTVTAESLRSVKKLTVDGTMTSLNELYNLTSLQELILDGVTLNHLSGIENCLQLNYVYFKSSVIKDYSALSTLGAKLNYLYLYNIDDAELETLCNDIKDAEFSNLQYVAVTGNEYYINHINSNETNYYYDAKSNKTITNIEPLKLLSSTTKSAVRYLTLQNNNIAGDLSAIVDYTNLYLLRCQYNNLINLNGLQNMSQLIWLAAQNNQLGATINSTGDTVAEDTTTGIAIASLENKSHLNVLNLINNSYLSNVNYLKNNTNIGCLWLRNCSATMNINGISNIILACSSNYSLPVKFLTADKYIVSEYYDVTTVTYDELYSDLYGNEYITILELKDTKLTNEQYQTILSSMTNLQFLSLAGCSNLTTIDFVAEGKVEGLFFLDIWDTKVTDVTNLNLYGLRVQFLRLNNLSIDLSTIISVVNRCDETFYTHYSGFTYRSTCWIILSC